MPPVRSFLYITWEYVYCHSLHFIHKEAMFKMVSFLPLLTAERRICRTLCPSENIRTIILKVGSLDQQYQIHLGACWRSRLSPLTGTLKLPLTLGL